jgi:Na+/H+ antiporter NhaD/arsenite permease-like protein
MVINGTMDWISQFMIGITGDDVFLTAIVILIATSLVASILSPNPTALLFIPILATLFEISPVLAQYSTPIIFAFISGLNIGNFFPQGAPCYLATINIAQNQRTPEISYQFIGKNGAIFSILHIIIAIGYIAIMCVILGIFL